MNFSFWKSLTFRKSVHFMNSNSRLYARVNISSAMEITDTWKTEEEIESSKKVLKTLKH
jgi:hypothetical protein